MPGEAGGGDKGRPAGEEGGVSYGGEDPGTSTRFADGEVQALVAGLEELDRERGAVWEGGIGADAGAGGGGGYLEVWVGQVRRISIRLVWPTRSLVEG